MRVAHIWNCIHNMHKAHAEQTAKHNHTWQLKHELHIQRCHMHWYRTVHTYRRTSYSNDVQCCVLNNIWRPSHTRAIKLTLTLHQVKYATQTNSELITFSSFFSFFRSSRESRRSKGSIFHARHNTPPCTLHTRPRSTHIYVENL